MFFMDTLIMTTAGMSIGSLSAGAMSMSVPMTSIFDGTGLIKNASTMDNLGELADIDPPRELQQATNTLNTVAQTNQTDSQMISMLAQVTSIDTAGEMANTGYAPSSEEQREEVKTMDDDDDEDESHESLYDDNLCERGRGETAGGDTAGGETAGGDTAGGDTTRGDTPGMHGTSPKHM
eukprot:783064_1